MARPIIFRLKQDLHSVNQDIQALLDRSRSLPKATADHQWHLIARGLEALRQERRAILNAIWDEKWKDAKRGSW